MILHIIDVTGVVHADRDGHTCPTSARAPRRKGVTPLQIHVYHLGPCSSCFPMRVSFDKGDRGPGMSVELLRRAAKRLRVHVADLPVRVQASWDQDGAEIYAGAEHEWVGETLADGGDEVSSYVALMHPPVALALADWLEFEARVHEAAGLSELASRARLYAVARAILRENS